MDSKILIVLVGPSGSGKTTMAKDIANHFNIALISIEEIRARIFGSEDNYLDEYRVSQSAYKWVLDLLKDSEYPAVIFDAPNCRRREREQLLSDAEKYYDYAICAVSDIDLETCLERNAKRNYNAPDDMTESAYTSLWRTWPSIGEGFDEIVYLDELDEVLATILPRY